MVGNNLKSQVESKLAPLERRFTEALAREIRVELMGSSFYEYIEPLVSGRVRSLGGFFPSDDPTKPSKHLDSVRQELRRNLSNSVVIVDTSITVNISLLSDEFLGLDTEGPTSNTDPTVMRWLYFFIHGNLDNDLYWVPLDSASSIGTYLGRFEGGYLIKGTKRAETLNRSLRKKGKSLIKKHPQSGKGPFPELFQSLLSPSIVEQKVIAPARVRAMQSLGAK